MRTRAAQSTLRPHTTRRLLRSRTALCALCASTRSLVTTVILARVRSSILVVRRYVIRIAVGVGWGVGWVCVPSSRSCVFHETPARSATVVSTRTTGLRFHTATVPSRNTCTSTRPRLKLAIACSKATSLASLAVSGVQLGRICTFNVVNIGSFRCVERSSLHSSIAHK